MAHEDAGHYAGKHPKGTKPDDRIAAAINARQADSRIACAQAEEVSIELGVSMAEVGVNVDLLELRIAKCQLGLYGYSTTKPHGAMIDDVSSVSVELEGAIKGALGDGRLSCASAWKIAADLKIAKMDVTAACDFLKLKIKPCQLGAF
jgi:hypothetical protein